MGAASEDPDVLERRVLQPDPGLVKSLGMHHTLESAVADLVDNSVDAGADRVLISFQVQAARPTGLVVVDNGRGMDGSEADEAMRLGRQRGYGAGEQGHFGIGLKAASFGHADTLTLHTRSGTGEYHGRRLRRSDVARDYSCDILDPSAAARESAGWLDRVEAKSGTVVQWSETRLPAVEAAGRDEWLESAKTNLRMHLGLIYHRLLQRGRLRLDIEVFDGVLREAGIPEPVVAIDPLGFTATAVSGYPKTLTAVVDGAAVALHCHIVPPKSSGPSYRLYGRDGAEFQGFYVYRNDRLLQAGGWNHVLTGNRDRALARVVIDDFPSLAGLVRMNPEKNGIDFTHALRSAVQRAAEQTTDGSETTLSEYVARAEAVLSESRRRRRARRPVAEPSRGLHEDVRRVIRAEIPLRKDEDPVEIRWRRMPPDRFIELDREHRIIYLNQHYRPMLTGGRTGLSDAPLLKTLVFLLTEEHFKGQYWGSRDRDLLDMWNEVLGAAVQVEHDYRLGGRD